MGPRAARDERPAIDEELQALLARVRPAPAEIVSLWPADRRGRIVLVIRVDELGAPSIAARWREHDLDAGDADVARAVRRIKDDVAVVFELGDRVVVVPLRALGSTP